MDFESGFQNHGSVYPELAKEPVNHLLAGVDQGHSVFIPTRDLIPFLAIFQGWLFAFLVAGNRKKHPKIAVIVYLLR